VKLGKKRAKKPCTSSPAEDLDLRMVWAFVRAMAGRARLYGVPDDVTWLKSAKNVLAKRAEEGKLVEYLEKRLGELLSSVENGDPIPAVTFNWREPSPSEEEPRPRKEKKGLKLGRKKASSPKLKMRRK